MSQFIFNMFKMWYLILLIKKGKNRIYSGPALKGLITRTIAVKKTLIIIMRLFTAHA